MYHDTSNPISDFLSDSKYIFIDKLREEIELNLFELRDSKEYQLIYLKLILSTLKGCELLFELFFETVNEHSSKNFFHDLDDLASYEKKYSQTSDREKQIIEFLPFWEDLIVMIVDKICMDFNIDASGIYMDLCFKFPPIIYETDENGKIITIVNPVSKNEIMIQEQHVKFENVSQKYILLKELGIIDFLDENFKFNSNAQKSLMLSYITDTKNSQPFQNLLSQIGNKNSEHYPFKEKNIKKVINISDDIGITRQTKIAAIKLEKNI